MTDQPDTLRPSRRGVWVAVLLGLIVLYPLSVGPVNWIINRGYVPGWMIDTLVGPFYAPLTWLYFRNDTFRALADWYQAAWR